MKSAVTLLLELMMNRGELPEYECIAQCGNAHTAVFQYRCCALGAEVVGSARSKRHAKQEAARLLLLALAAGGVLSPAVAATVAALPAVPTSGFAAPAAPAEPYTAPALPATVNAPPLPPDPSTKPYISLLKELCQQYRLGSLEWTVVGDTGPPHARQFTVAGRLGALERRATAPTKKAARQAAAELLYNYLRTNLQHRTADFVESEAIERAHERTMGRDDEDSRDAQSTSSSLPPLSARVADYHLAMPRHAAAKGAAACAAALEAIERGEAQEACAALGLRLERHVLQGHSGPMHIVTAEGVYPPPTAMDASPAAADAVLMCQLHWALSRVHTLPTSNS